MSLNKIIIFLFVTCLLSSNLLWAAEREFNNLNSSNEHVLLDIELDFDNDILHHTVDEHHDGHECHMSAHLVGLNSHIFTIGHIDSSQVYPNFILRFSTHQLSPPNKPPRV